VNELDKVFSQNVRLLARIAELEADIARHIETALDTNEALFKAEAELAALEGRRCETCERCDAPCWILVAYRSGMGDPPSKTPFCCIRWQAREETATALSSTHTGRSGDATPRQGDGGPDAARSPESLA
jgi:tRNA(Ile)-lysidine synthase TilS/MesJ